MQRLHACAASRRLQPFHSPTHLLTCSVCASARSAAGPPWSTPPFFFYVAFARVHSQQEAERLERLGGPEALTLRGSSTGAVHGRGDSGGEWFDAFPGGTSVARAADPAKAVVIVDELYARR